MRKLEAVKIITSCAKEYDKNLAGNHFLFIFGNPQCPQFFEVAFNPANFLHLTGVKFDTTIQANSLMFYSKCLGGKLKESEISFHPNGTTEMKLLILPQIMKIYRTAKMIGDYNATNIHLQTEKLAGNLTACLGFVRGGKYYYPNTALKEDIRNISSKPQQRILAVLRKPSKDSVYQEVCYTAKNIQIEEISFGKEIRSLIGELLSTIPE